MDRALYGLSDNFQFMNGSEFNASYLIQNTSQFKLLFFYDI